MFPPCLLPHSFLAPWQGIYSNKIYLYPKGIHENLWNVWYRPKIWWTPHPHTKSFDGFDVTLRQNWTVFIRCHKMAMGVATLIMVPINFWQNSYLFEKKNTSLAQKLTKIYYLKENLSNFSKKISLIQDLNLWNVFGGTMMILSIRLNNFGPSWLWKDLI